MGDRLPKFLFNLPFFLTVLFLTGFGGVLAGEGVERAPTPDWIVTTPIPEPLPEHADEISGGTYYLLLAEHGSHDGQTRTDYFRYAKKIINRNGLEDSSSLSLSYRPGIERLQLHGIALHRDGETIDLTDVVDLQRFRREDRLSGGILDGRITVFANLPGVRVGDIVEYAYSYSYSTIMMPEHFYDSWTASYSQPVARLEFSMRVPEEFDLQFRLHGFSEAPEVTVSDGMRTYRWSRTPPIDPLTKSAPYWYDAGASLDASSIGSWGDIVKASLPGYPENADLPEAFRAKLEAIRAETDDRRVWISKVLRLVQDDIRYVGIEIGDGAFVPRSPTTVHELGYGDCKDKAHLMATGLRWLGIDAAPALVHSSRGSMLPERLPSPFAFNHAIVRVRLLGETYWLDPTLTLQHSADPRLSQVAYGHALPIAADVQGLEAIEPIVLYEPLTRITETVTFRYGKNLPPFLLMVETRYKGEDADAFRHRVAQRGLASLRKSYLDYYDKLYRGMREAEKMRVEEDGSGAITVTESYEATGGEDYDELAEEFPLQADAVRSILPDADPEFDNPVRLTFPLFTEHRIVLRNLRTNLEPLERFWLSHPYLDYSLGSRKQGRTLSVTWRLRTRRDHVKASEVDDYAKLIDEIEDNAYWSYDVRPNPAPAGN